MAEGTKVTTWLDAQEALSEKVYEGVQAGLTRNELVTLLEGRAGAKQVDAFLSTLIVKGRIRRKSYNQFATTGRKRDLTEADDGKVRELLLEGNSVRKVAALLNVDTNEVTKSSQRLKLLKLIAYDGHVGRWVPPDQVSGSWEIDAPWLSEQDEASTNGVASAPEPVESRTGRQALPEYMRKRKSITISIERSAEELSGIMRLELCISGVWVPVPVLSNLRLFVGDYTPNWSPTQEMYTQVSVIRAVLESGEVREFAHNPQMPVTVDVLANGGAS